MSGIVRIAIVGAESSGKTTLAQALAEKMGGEFVREYAREYFVDRTDPVDWKAADFIQVCHGYVVVVPQSNKREF
jgi:nicotinamide riboside kinase